MVDVGAQRAPTIDGSVQSIPFYGLHGAVRSDPCHDLRVREVSSRAADLPDPVIRLTPARLERVSKPRCRSQLSPSDAAPLRGCVVHHIHHFVIHVKLKLRGGGVPDPPPGREFS